MSAFQSLSSVLFPALFIGGNNFDNYLALFVVLGSAVQIEGLKQRLAASHGAEEVCLSWRHSLSG